MMKTKLYWRVWVAVAIAVLGFGAMAARGAHVFFDLDNYVAGHPANRKVLLTPAGVRASTPKIYVLDTLTFQSDLEGQFWASNMVAGLYGVEVQGPPRVTRFEIQVPDTNGVLYASDLVPVVPNPATISEFYTRNQADGRFVTHEALNLAVQFKANTRDPNVFSADTNHFTGAVGIGEAYTPLLNAATANIGNTLNTLLLNVGGMSIFDAPAYFNAGLSGDGSLLHTLDASALATGTIPPERLPSSITATFSGDGAGVTNLQVAGAMWTNGSVNTFAIKRTLVDRSYPTNGLNIGALGDSMPWRFFRFIDPYLAERYGTNGFAFGAPSAENMATGICYAESDPGQVIANKWNATDTTYSTMSYATLEVGEYVTWTNRLDERGWEANTVAVYYRKESGGGTFDVQVSTNGGPFGTVATVSCANATVAGGVASVTLPRAKYRLRTLGVSGIARVLDVGVWDSQSSGVRSTWLASGGINIMGMLAHSNLYQNVWSTLNLDLLFVQLKDAQGDISVAQFEANWPNFERLLTNSFPRADIVLVSSTPQLNSDPLLQWQDSYWRTRALLNGWAYVDVRNPLGSQSVQTNYGMADALGVHPNEAGGHLIAGKIIGELGLDRLPPYKWSAPAKVAVTNTWFFMAAEAIANPSSSGGGHPAMVHVHASTSWDVANSGYFVYGLPFTNAPSYTQYRFGWQFGPDKVMGRNFKVEPIFLTTNVDSVNFWSVISALRPGVSEVSALSGMGNVVASAGTNWTVGSKTFTMTNNPADVMMYHFSIGGYSPGGWSHTNYTILMGVKVSNW